MDERQALRAAAEYISEHGWCQGATFEGDLGQWMALRTTPPACALGALSIGTGQGFRYEMFFSARKLLAKAAGLPNGSAIPSWNDHPSQTAEDVILALKQAAEL